ncbi:MAG: glycosyltransferase [Desulfuromonadaceae bacterium]|nr:glycosyltransferase [Desulfuromonadaceae bacterium]
MPEVSVIIPAYNAAAYLAKALQSLARQTYQNFEIIVVDDGSTDNSTVIVQRFPNVRYHYQENQGEAAARNKGMELARGQFLAFLDADDWYEPSKLEKQVRFLHQHPHMDVVYCDFRTYDEKSGRYSVLPAEPYQPERANFLARVLFRQILPNLACSMLRRACYTAGCRFKPGLRHAPDYDFCLQLLEQFTFGYLQEPLYGYRRHAGNVTNAHAQQKASEVRITRGLGLEKINHIVAQSTFSSEEKNLLLARILLKIGEYSACLALLSKAKFPDDSPLPLFYAGNCHYALGALEDSRSCYQSALARQQEFPEALNNLGCVLLKRDGKNATDKLFRKALELRPGYMDAEKNLAGEDAPHLTQFELRTILTHYC